MPSHEKIDLVLGQFRGEIMQIPPMYSAVKVNGKKLYEYARENKTVERPKRKVTIFDIERLERKGSSNHSFWIKVTCSKGSQSLLHINTKKHRETSQTTTKSLFLHNLRLSSSPSYSQLSSFLRILHGRTIHQPTVSQIRLRSSSATSNRVSPKILSGLDHI